MCGSLKAAAQAHLDSDIQEATMNRSAATNRSSIWVVGRFAKPAAEAAMILRH
jgi:hypothetical protein